MSNVRELMYGSYDDVEFPAFYIEGSPVRPMSESAYYSMLMDFGESLDFIQIKDIGAISALVYNALVYGGRLFVNGHEYTMYEGLLLKDGISADLGSFLSEAVLYYTLDSFNLIEDAVYLGCYASGTSYSDKLVQLDTWSK